MRSMAALFTCALYLTACGGQQMPVALAPAMPQPIQTLRQAKPVAALAKSQTEHPGTHQEIQNQVIVKYKSGFSTQATTDRLPGSQVLDAFNTSGESAQLHQLPPNMTMNKALQSYQANKKVEFAIPNIRFDVQMEESTTQSEAATLNDPLSDQQWYLNTLQMPAVWQANGLGSDTVKVAVLDTGVDYTHPDLKDKVILGPDYIDRDNDPKDMHGHGTHVAGIVAAQLNNQTGIAGLAPNVKIVAVRVLDAKGGGSLFNIAKGIAYAANNGIKVINLSLGSPPGGVIMRTLANFIGSYAEMKGSLVIAAAGNEGGAIGLPAAASKFMAVGAVNNHNTLATFSNRGKQLSVVAPGVNILSTFPTYEVTANQSGLPQNYASLNGTSMATPMVAAHAALLWSRNPQLKPAQVRQKIESSATDLGAVGKDETFGYGLINIANSMAKL